jgi:signal transduction histidine kinase
MKFIKKCLEFFSQLFLIRAGRFGEFASSISHQQFTGGAATFLLAPDNAQQTQPLVMGISFFMQSHNADSKRRKILWLFSLGIGLPSLLLGYLAYRGIQNDQALLEKQTIERHRKIATLVTASIQDDIRKAEASFGSALADYRAPHQLSSFPFLDTLKIRFPLVQEVFFIENAAAIRFPAARFLYDGAAQPEANHAFPAAMMEMMQEAQHCEFQLNDHQRALAIYQKVFAQASHLQMKGELLNAMARVQKRLMLIPEAIESYRKISEDWRNVRMASGMPLGLIARLELGSLFLAQQDTVHASETLLSLYQTLVEGEWALEKSHYEFFAQKTAALIHELLGVSLPSTMQPAQNIFIMLKTKEEMQKAITEKLLAFRQFAAPPLRDKISRAGIHSRSSPDRFNLEASGRSYLVSLLSVPDVNTTWGLLFDENVLKTQILLAATQLISLENVQWVVTDEDGQVLSKLAQPAGAQLSVRKSFAGNFPPWSLELYQKESLFLQTLVASGRGIYLYAFVLIGIILIVGLAVTLRSIEHELELSRMKSDFVSTVSHEFKSPLTSIRQLVEMLQSNRVPSEARRRQYYDVIVEQSKRLSMLVDDVLDFSRMEEGRKVFSFEVTDLSELLHEVVSRIQHQVDHAGFHIHADIPGQLPAVKADRLAVSEAVANLLDNAIKYSGSADHLEIRAFLENQYLVIAVQDFGIGIDKEEIPKIFDRFYRGGDSLTRSIEGTGLGLTLVKQIALAHRGTIQVESERGKGSTFSIRLPIPTMRSNGSMD